MYDFGIEFYFSDDLALIRAHAQDEENNRYSVVLIYQNTYEIWSDVQRIIGNDGGFGNGLLITGALILIGDPSFDSQFYDDSGAIHCYADSDDGWQENMLLTPSNPAEGGDLVTSLLNPTNIL